MFVDASRSRRPAPRGFGLARSTALTSRRPVEVEYRIEEVRPHVFAVVIRDGYDRGMTFCRSCMYYECRSRKFRGNHFSFWEFMRWYSKRRSDAFPYASEYRGFNMPLRVALDCMAAYGLGGAFAGGFEIPHDEIMAGILGEISRRVPSEEVPRAYLIGVDKLKGPMFLHEVCHARYYCEPAYRETVDGVTRSLPEKDRRRLSQNLVEAGYAREVVMDEFQAYAQHGHKVSHITKGVSSARMASYQRRYREALAAKGLED